MIRLGLNLLSDVIRDSQRVPMIATGALLLAITLAVFATAFDPIEPVLLGGVLMVLEASDHLPFVRLSEYMSFDGPGSGSLSLDTAAAGGFLRDVLVPLYGWFTLVLVVISQIVRRPAPALAFWPRYRGVLIFIGISLLAWAAAALMRADVAGLWVLFLVLTIAHVFTGAWATLTGLLVDGLIAQGLRVTRSERPDQS